MPHRNLPRKFPALATVFAALVLCGCAADPVSGNAKLASAVRECAPNCELYSVAFKRVCGEKVSAELVISAPWKKAEEISLEMEAGTLTAASREALRAYDVPVKKQIRKLNEADAEELGKRLFLAVRSGNIALAKKLIFAGANPNAEEIGRETQLTPLAIAVQRNDIPTARLLLMSGADPNAPLRFESIQFAGTFDEGTAIHLATCNGTDAMIRLLARYGAYLDAVCSSDEKFSRRVNALGLAIKIKRYNVIRALLANGANADVACDYDSRKGEDYRNLPVVKSEEANNYIVNLLVDAGAGLDVGAEGTPPLVRAVNLGNAALVEKMLRLGANPNFEHHEPALKLRNGKSVGGTCTPIFHAENPKIAELLVNAGADLNYTISEGWFGPDYRVFDAVEEPQTRKYLLSRRRKIAERKK